MTVLDKFLKRSFDFLFSLIGLLFFFPLISVAWIIATIDTKSNGFFVQQRVGKEGKLFKVVKIKTMRQIKGLNTSVTAKNDARITKSGAIFRRTKIDEFPQLWNVLKGDMSFVGPRPDVPGYADLLQGEDRIILTIRPGITGPATIVFKNEESILAKVDHPENYNRTVIWPEKIRINKDYIKKYSFAGDLYYIYRTIFAK